MIQINKLNKSYGGQEVLNNINLHVGRGQVYALLGKNGAGKTTMINTLIDLIQPGSGQIFINQTEHNKLTQAEKSKIGIVGEQLALIEEMNGLEYLNLIGKIYQIPTTILTTRINDLFSYFFENENDLKKNIANYSTGMQKKIAFCAAVIHTPELLVLDEPFSGLDPLVANQMVNFLIQYHKENRCIFISSHDLNYVQKIATNVGVLSDGELVFNSTLKDFTENGVNSLDDALLKILNPNEVEHAKIEWV